MEIEIGQTVRLVHPVIQGEVLDIQYDKDTKSLAMLISYDEDGEVHQRWLPEFK